MAYKKKGQKKRRYTKAEKASYYRGLKRGKKLTKSDTGQISTIAYRRGFENGAKRAFFYAEDVLYKDETRRGKSHDASSYLGLLGRTSFRTLIKRMGWGNKFDD